MRCTTTAESSFSRDYRACDRQLGPRDSNQRGLTLPLPDLGDEALAWSGLITHEAELTQRVSNNGRKRFTPAMRTGDLREGRIQDEPKLLITHTATTLSDDQVPLRRHQRQERY